MATDTVRFFDGNDVLTAKATPDLEHQLIKGLILGVRPELEINNAICSGGIATITNGSIKERANSVLDFIQKSEQQFNEEYDSWKGALSLFTRENHETGFCYHLTEKTLKGSRLNEIIEMVKARFPGTPIATMNVGILKPETLTGTLEERIEALARLRESKRKEEEANNRQITADLILLLETSTKDETHGNYVVVKSKPIPKEKEELCAIKAVLLENRPDLTVRFMSGNELLWVSFTGSIEERAKALLKMAEEQDAPYTSRNTRPRSSGFILKKDSPSDQTFALYVIYDSKDRE